METQEIVTQTTEPAATQESAPVETTEVVASQETTENNEQIATENSVEEEGAKPSKAVQELIDQRKKRQKAEQEAAYWRGRAEAEAARKQQEEYQAQQAAIAQQQAQVQQQQAAEMKPPSLEDFATYSEWEVAKDEYLIKVAEARALSRLSQFQQQQIQQQQLQQQALEQKRLRETFDKRIEQAAKDDPTISSIVNDVTLPVSPIMGHVIQQSEAAPQILKWLSNNREMAQKISFMDPISAARELGLIEAQVRTTKITPPKKVSSAPSPIQPVATSGAITDENDLPIDQWIARRNKQQFKR